MAPVDEHRLDQGILLRHHRWRLNRGEALPQHRHGFAECFWVEQGRGMQETPQESTPVAVGDLWFLPPRSIHRLCAPEEPLVWANVSIAPACAATWRRRYGADWRPWPWAQAQCAARLDADGCRLLMACLHGISAEERSPAQADTWLLRMWRLLSGIGTARAPLPAWLERALAVVRTPAGLRDGVPALVAASGRHADHVSRTVRHRLGTTPSRLVRDLRLDHAAMLLRTGGGHDILAVALECGFDHPSYFARAFRARFGQSPSAYRRAAPAIGGVERA